MISKKNNKLSAMTAILRYNYVVFLLIIMISKKNDELSEMAAKLRYTYDSF